MTVDINNLDIQFNTPSSPPALHASASPAQADPLGALRHMIETGDTKTLGNIMTKGAFRGSGISPESFANAPSRRFDPANCSPDIRPSEQFENMPSDPGWTLEHYRQTIPDTLRKLGIDPADHPRAIGYLLNEIEDPKVLGAINDNLTVFANGQAGRNPVESYESFEKLTWMIAGLTIPHDSPANAVAFNTAIGGRKIFTTTMEALGTYNPERYRATDSVCTGINVPNLDGISTTEDPATSRALAYVVGSALDERKRISPSKEASSITELLAPIDSELVAALRDLNRALRDSYENRRFMNEPPGLCTTDPKASPNRPAECTLQFATATGRKPVSTIAPDGRRVALDLDGGATNPDFLSDLGEKVKYGPMPTSHDFFITILSYSLNLSPPGNSPGTNMQENTAPETDTPYPYEDGDPGTPSPDGGERFKYPSAAPAPS